MTDNRNEFLRHTLATILYRFEKAVRKTNNQFGNYDAGSGVRSPIEIIHHMFHVMQFSKGMVLGKEFEKDIREDLLFHTETSRFIDELKEIDQLLVQKELGVEQTNRILQGPFSDVLTHIGQLSMLRRMSGDPISKEDFSEAQISKQ